MSAPTLGHLDPEFLQVMDEIADMLRVIFGTKNRLTMPMSGTGSAGMETLFVNLLQPGARVLIGVNGVFGTRMAEVARRCGAEVITAETEWGRVFSPEDLAAKTRGQRFDVIALVHAETSTGAAQPLEGMRAVADTCGALLLTDCVTSLGGMPVELDHYGVDAAYSGTQKCLSCPPGLAPVSLSARAEAVMAKRNQPVQSWYLDLGLIAKYWGGERAYHHTAPVNQLYGLHEALRLVLEEGLEARYARHAENGQALERGLQTLGLSLWVEVEHRLTQLTSVRLPKGFDDMRGRHFLLENFGIEVGGGLGPMAGQVWRIGLMGHGSQRSNVELCLRGVAASMAEQGLPVPKMEVL
ncbi:MAG: alanine--glyoxylate aminotransferase family protein [Planctomycetes bacterium]|nr:alanine--glyoxylate aminotransferase family protein [Planctomycetota bacterium]